MNSWKFFYETVNGNSYPHSSLIVFFYRYVYKIKKKKVNILDLGSGTGSILKLIKKKSHYLDCVDISKEALKKIENKNNINTFNKDICDFLKFSKKKYDFIIDSTSIQHLSEDRIKQSYSFINKNLKKDGFFFSINLNSDNGLSDKKFYVTKFKKNKLLNLFKLCKLKKIEYNWHTYTENNSKSYIKFNIIQGQKKNT